MHPDEICLRLRTAEDLPIEALEAAAADPAPIASAVEALIGAAVRGVYLTLPEERLLLLGLHALAAARWTPLFPAVIDLLRLDEGRLEDLLGFDYLADAPSLLLSVYDGDAAPLYRLIDDPSVNGDAKSIPFSTLTALAVEGRAPRQPFVDLLDRFDREPTAEPESLAWYGWQEAILALGLTEFEPRVRAGWKAGRMPVDREVDRRDWRKRLAEAAAHPERAADLADVAHTIDRPAERLGRLFSPSEDEPLEQGPAAGIALAAAEEGWLSGFLHSRPDPETTMSLEQLDGFFTGLLAGC